MDQTCEPSEGERAYDLPIMATTGAKLISKKQYTIPCSDAVRANLSIAVVAMSGGLGVAVPVPGGVLFKHGGKCHTWGEVFPWRSRLLPSQKSWLRDVLPALVVDLDRCGVYLNDPHLDRCLLVITTADGSRRIGIRSAFLAEEIGKDSGGSPLKTNIEILQLVNEYLSYHLFKREIMDFCKNR